MTKTDTTPTSAPRRLVRTKATWIASVFLVSGIALAGCATGTTDTAATSSASSSAATATDTSTTTTADATTTAQTISDTTAAAEAFLATLSDEQRESVLYDYDDETKTTSWSNFPVTFVQRAGLNLADLTDEQKTAALAVLEALLSDEAYETVSGIMGGDEYLHENRASAQPSTAPPTPSHSPPPT